MNGPVTVKALEEYKRAKHMYEEATRLFLTAKENLNSKWEILNDAVQYQIDLDLYEAREEKKAEEKKKECSICLEKYIGNYISWLPCFHGFCENCIQTTEKNTNELWKKCPLCNHKYRVDERNQGDSFP